MKTWPRAARVRPALERLLAETSAPLRMRSDPVELVHRYRDPLDIEVAGLLCAALAYGRVDLFKPRLSALLEALGPSPAAVARDAKPAELLRRAAEFSYRMTGPRDVACLLYGAGRIQREHGSLGTFFAAAYRERLRIADLPGIPADQSRSLRAYAWSDTCGRCRWGARISLLQLLFDDHWTFRFLQSQRAGN